MLVSDSLSCLHTERLGKILERMTCGFGVAHRRVDLTPERNLLRLLCVVGVPHVTLRQLVGGKLNIFTIDLHSDEMILVLVQIQVLRLQWSLSG